MEGIRDDLALSAARFGQRRPLLKVLQKRWFVGVSRLKVLTGC